MATLAQIQANRQNSLKSTGPKTESGKLIASRNSTRHGFYATTVLLPDEDKEEFLRFARRLVSAYSPCGVLEEELVRSIIETRWQLRRANLVDSELFEIYSNYEGQKRGVGTAFAQDATQGNAFSKLTKYHGFLLRKLRLAEQDLLELKEKSSQPMPLVQAPVFYDGTRRVLKTIVVPDHVPKVAAEVGDIHHKPLTSKPDARLFRLRASAGPASSAWAVAYSCAARRLTGRG
jgi:hypothetical protein